MRQFTRNAGMTYLACGLVGIAMGVGLGASSALAGGGGSTTTAQSGMVVVDTPASVIIQNEITWSLDMSAVKATYTNTLTSVVTAGCTGGGSNSGQPCDPAK